MSLPIFFLFTGCINPQSETSPGAKLDTYRKVYLIQAKKDSRDVGPRVEDRLKKTGFKVKTVMEDEDNLGSQGTGFVVNPEGDILTCAHVVGTQTNATAWIEGQRYVCRILLADTNADLAVLRIQGNTNTFLPLRFAASTNYILGQDVFSLGFPLADILGMTLRLNKGLISATVGLDNDQEHIQFSAPVQPGNSGGPLLNPQCEVVGVIAATLNPMSVLARSGGNLPQNVNFALKLDPVRRFLDSAKVVSSGGGTNPFAGSFDAAQKSVAYIHAGIVTDEELRQPATICVYEYLSLWDVWFRFRAIEIRFYDAKKGGILYKVGQYQDDPLSSENSELDRLFRKISDDFFPNQPNPFGEKRKNSPAASPASS